MPVGGDVRCFIKLLCPLTIVTVECHKIVIGMSNRLDLIGVALAICMMVFC